MINELTPEQTDLIKSTRDFWLNYIFSCKNEINRDQAKIGIDWLYQLAGCDAPVIVYLDSPMACQYGTHILKTLFAGSGAQVWAQVRDQVRDQVKAQVWAQVRDQVGDQVGDQVRDQVGDQVRDQVWDQVRDQVRDQVWAQVRDQVWDQVWDQVRDQVWDQVRDQVRDQVWDQVRDQVRAQVRDQEMTFEPFSGYGHIGDYGWVSFFHFFTQIGVVNHEKFNQFKALIGSGIYDMIQLNGFCIVSGLPNKISRNEAGRLHDINGPAIQFRDSYAQYYVQGRAIPQATFRKLQQDKYTLDDFTKEGNEEIKSASIAYLQERHGDSFVVNFFREHLKEVDNYVDRKDVKFLHGTTGGMNVGVYTLFRGRINGVYIAYVRCYCPSTDRMFFLGVSSEHSKAKDAIASLYRVPRTLAKDIVSINRQGERYSTSFTPEGLVKLRSLSKEEIEDLVPVSGDTYFAKIQYEY